ncbi:MAG: di-trans,poly-cis-decaprenylcistransferase [Candidatus Aenigmarchaeota archaeon]|nr:di-trans,poly-cis-decaprenylcistransferase [Candidatus Aenigmarchaeota archaeon]
MLKHVAIIPDGNRRYAEKKKISLKDSYQKSIDKLPELVSWCKEQKIEILTIWGFSSENWKRSEAEIGTLQELFDGKMEQALKEKLLEKEGVQVHIAGNLSKFPARFQKFSRQIEEKTKKNKALKLNLLINYGGREEIITAVNKLLSEKKKSVTAEDFKKYLWLDNEPDLIIRTSGEQRTSGLLPFQSVYSELHFSKKHFPDFGKKDFLAAIKDYNKRQRRFGK